MPSHGDIERNTGPGVQLPAQLSDAQVQSFGNGGNANLPSSGDVERDPGPRSKAIRRCDCRSTGQDPRGRHKTECSYFKWIELPRTVEVAPKRKLNPLSLFNCDCRLERLHNSGRHCLNCVYYREKAVPRTVEVAPKRKLSPLSRFHCDCRLPGLKNSGRHRLNCVFHREKIAHRGESDMMPPRNGCVSGARSADWRPSWTCSLGLCGFCCPCWRCVAPWP